MRRFLFSPFFSKRIYQQLHFRDRVSNSALRLFAAVPPCIIFSDPATLHSSLPCPCDPRPSREPRLNPLINVPATEL